jgi:hypothetical protein
MDISEELNEIKIGLNNPQTVLDSLLKQRDEFNKKIHIFIVLNIASAIKEMIDSNMFQEHDIASINISHKYNDEIFTNFIDFKLFDSNSNKIEYVLSSAEKFQLKQRLTDLFNDLYDFSYDNINEDFAETTQNLKLVSGADEKLLDLLLSKELRIALDYSELKTSFADSKNNKKEVKSKL